MAGRPKKVIILGLDAPIAPRLYKYCKEGKLPYLSRISDRHVQGALGDIHADTDCFLCHWLFSLLARPCVMRA